MQPIAFRSGWLGLHMEMDADDNHWAMIEYVASSGGKDFDPPHQASQTCAGVNSRWTWVSFRIEGGAA
jgi:hypothetical protein